MPRFDATTIGEGKLRYCVPAGVRLEDAENFKISITGTEGNVMALLSRLGHQTGWVSQLPDSPLGRRVARDFKTAGVDTSTVQWLSHEAARLGIYYVEYAHPPRSTQVYYDRKRSCFTEITPQNVNWDYVLDTRLLHLSGLTLPLSDTVKATLFEAQNRAIEAGIPVSFDVNYRSRLWSPEAAAEGMRPFLDAADIIFMAARDAETLYGIIGDNTSKLKQISEMFGADYVAMSMGADGIMGFDRQKDQVSSAPARKVVIEDRIGAGDASVGGVLHGWLQGDFAKGLRYATVTAGLALSQFGDHTITNAQEVEELLDVVGGDIVR
ncbi:MAG: sugar kinase [Chloroflexota bacterium]